jgi:Na+-transporting methylmalonyl-CoA/oxaloacetate decarboxylase gamma subunit
MIPLAPLFADVGAIIFKLVLFLLIFGIPAIGQLIAKMKTIHPPAGGPLPQAPKRPVPTDVVNEIEDFLKRAAQKREGKQIVAPQVRQAPRRVERIEQPVKAEVVSNGPVGGKVEEHVKKYLDSEEFARRESQLGEEVAQADKAIDQHLSQVFDHQVSRLASLPGEAAAPPVAYEPQELADASTLEIPATFATGLGTLLADADSVRQAIVLSEIFRRPEERWA